MTKNPTQRATHIIDATDRPMGRLASEIAVLLRGKHKTSFEPHLDSGDIVLVKNVKYMKLTGKKMEQKVYHRSTLYPGGIRTTQAKELMEKDPAKLLKMSVRLMLPETTHRANQLKRLTFEQ
jgi:large subunit ribosomal protein L13